LQQNTQPYQDLDPNVIITAIESIGLLCSGSLLALNSYENRVYQVGIEDAKPLIAKFYRPGRWSTDAILEEHQFALELADAEIPVVPPLMINTKTLHHYENYRFALFERHGGRALDVDNVTHLEWIGRFIGRVHAIGATKTFQHRGKLDPTSHGKIPYQFLIDNQFIPEYLKHNYCLTMENILKKIDEIFQSVGNIRYLRIHGDCQLGNVLWNDAGPHIVDLDDSVMGPAIQDIWMFLSGTPVEKEKYLAKILKGYREFYDFDMREVILIETLRTLRMIQYSAWIANRWDDPAFPRAFPWFNTPNYWEEQLRNLQEQSQILHEI
jgi:Ser/Thr protein kinase RdoA (MazF antagonist)